MGSLTVKAMPGTRCPMEGKPREYITDSKAVTVQASAGYRRLVADGSLIVQPGTAPAEGKKGGN